MMINKKPLIALSAFLFCVFCSNISNAQNHTFNVTGRKGQLSARLIIKVGIFEKSKHRVRIRQGITWVDGHEAFGADQSVPYTEIQSISLFFGNQRFVIPRLLYADCFEPNLGDQSFSIKLLKSSPTVIVKMHGADAAAAYRVKWVFRRNGKHFRRIATDFSWPDRV